MKVHCRSWNIYFLFVSFIFYLSSDINIKFRYLQEVVKGKSKHLLLIGTEASMNDLMGMGKRIPQKGSYLVQRLQYHRMNNPLKRYSELLWYHLTNNHLQCTANFSSATRFSCATIRTSPYNTTASFPSAPEIKPFRRNHNEHKKEEEWLSFWKTI